MGTKLGDNRLSLLLGDRRSVGRNKQVREQNDESVMQQKKNRMFNKKEREMSKYWSFLAASFSHEL